MPDCALLYCLPFLHTDKDLEEKTMTAVGGARKRITAEIHELSERLKTNREAVQRLKEQIEEVEREEHGS